MTLDRSTIGKYTALTPWTALPAVVVTILILAGAIAASAALTFLNGVSGGDGASAGQDSTLVQLAPLVLIQLLIVLMVVAVAGLYGGRRKDVLSLSPPYPPAAAYVWATTGLVAILIPYNTFVLLVAPEIILADLKPFIGLLRRDHVWLAFLVIVIGAPLSEELLFRGFLQSALAKSRLGYIGASVVTTLSWAALHANYSIFGLIEVALVGFYFAFILWKTGNLWIPIVCHAIHNGTLLLILFIIDVPA